MRILIALLSRVEGLLARIRVRFILMRNDISVGPDVKVASSVRLRVTDGAPLLFGAEVEIDRFADITAKYGTLRIGTRVYIDQGTVICAREEIMIGSDVLIAEHVTIRDQDHQFGIDMITSEAGFSTSPVFIEDNVRIGKNSVVGANSVVTRDVPCDVVVAGVPAKIIRRIQ